MGISSLYFGDPNWYIKQLLKKVEKIEVSDDPLYFKANIWESDRLKSLRAQERYAATWEQLISRISTIIAIGVALVGWNLKIELHTSWGSPLCGVLILLLVSVAFHASRIEAAYGRIKEYKRLEIEHELGLTNRISTCKKK